MNEPVILERPDGILAVREPEIPPPHRLLVLLHGWEGSELSMWVFARNLPQDYWVIAPRGPVVQAPGSYGWRPTILGRRSLLDENLQPARDLISRIDGWAGENKVAAEHFSLMGFSQGAALVYVLASLFPERLARAAALSGYPPRGLDLASVALQGKPFLVTHGSQDEMIAVGEAQRAVEALQKAGAKVTYIEEPVGHKVGPKGMLALTRFFQ